MEGMVMGDTNGNGKARKCSVSGCERSYCAKGLCYAHYRQQHKGRVPGVIKKQRSTNTPPRIEYEEVSCDNPLLRGPCHSFKGGKDRGGYGVVSVSRRRKYAHRYVWEQAFGPIPDGLVIDHQCRNRACVNIGHLRLVTRTANVLENSNSPSAINSQKTRCNRGHEFTEGNTRYESRGQRVCRKCGLMRTRIWLLKQKLRRRGTRPDMASI
jgi:hypothetical protein